MSKIIGHQRIVSFLEKAVRAEKPAHAYLFFGPESVGKRSVALDMAEILQGKPAPNPDFSLIETEEDRKEITISQIRRLIHGLSLSAHSSKWKIVLINNAHLMEGPAANAFLKALEEPRGDTVIFLVTHDLNSILPTIISRCQTIKFNNVPFAEIKKNIGADDELIKLSCGRPGFVIDNMESGDWRKKFNEAKSDFNFLLSSNWTERYDWVGKKADKEDMVRETVDFWAVYLRDSLLSSLGDVGKIFPKLKKVLEARDFLRNSDLNTKFILENLLLKIT